MYSTQVHVIAVAATTTTAAASPTYPYQRKEFCYRSASYRNGKWKVFNSDEYEGEINPINMVLSSVFFLCIIVVALPDMSHAFCRCGCAMRHEKGIVIAVSEWVNEWICVAWNSIRLVRKVKPVGTNTEQSVWLNMGVGMCAKYVWRWRYGCLRFFFLLRSYEQSRHCVNRDRL